MKALRWISWAMYMGACTSKKISSSEVKLKGQGVCKQKKKFKPWNKTMKVKTTEIRNLIMLFVTGVEGII